MKCAPCKAGADRKIPFRAAAKACIKIAEGDKCAPSRHQGPAPDVMGGIASTTVEHSRSSNKKPMPSTPKQTNGLSLVSPAFSSALRIAASVRHSVEWPELCLREAHGVHNDDPIAPRASGTPRVSRPFCLMDQAKNPAMTLGVYRVRGGRQLKAETGRAEGETAVTRRMVSTLRACRSSGSRRVNAAAIKMATNAKTIPVHGAWEASEG